MRKFSEIEFIEQLNFFGYHVFLNLTLVNLDTRKAFYLDDCYDFEGYFENLEAIIKKTNPVIKKLYEKSTSFFATESDKEEYFFSVVDIVENHIFEKGYEMINKYYPDLYINIIGNKNHPSAVISKIKLSDIDIDNLKKDKGFILGKLIDFPCAEDYDKITYNKQKRKYISIQVIFNRNFKISNRRDTILTNVCLNYDKYDKHIILAEKFLKALKSEYSPFKDYIENVVVLKG